MQCGLFQLSNEAFKSGLPPPVSVLHGFDSQLSISIGCIQLLIVCTQINISICIVAMSF